MALLKFKRSATPSKVPTTSDLALGELALNTYDGKVYMKKDDGTQAIVEVGGTSGGGTVTSVAATAGTGISVSGSPITTSGTLTITNTAPDQTVTLTQAGTTTITGTYPNFTISSADQYDGTVTSVSGAGTVNGLTLSGTVTSSGSLTLGGTLSGIDLTSQITGTLPVANGGTGATSLTSGYVLKGNGTSPVSASVIYDSGTNVGIGTSSPSSSLNVVSTAIYPIRFETTSTSGMHLCLSDANTTSNISTAIAGQANNLLFRTNSAERMRITSAGNVGIGTTSPDSKVDIEAANSQLRLTDSDDSKFVEFSYSGGKLITRNNSTSTTVNQFTLDESGRLGIGTISPSQTLQVQGTGYATSDFRAPLFYDSDNTAYYFDGAGNSVLNTARVENLGVGVNAGSYGLYVYHTDNFEGGLFQTNQGGSLIRFIDSTSNAIEMGIQSGNPVIRTGNTPRLTVDNASGYVTASQSFRAPIFYDSGNTAYYVDPNGTSNLNGMVSNGRIDMQSTDGYQLESGKHRITYNDGGGNFNIRVGHEYDSGNVSTETGYAGWIEYTQSSGLWQFWTSDASVTSGGAVSFNEAIRISPTAVTLYYDGASKLDTTSTGITVTGTVSATTFSGGLSGNASTASTLQTARTISLTGDVSGSTSFDGSANVSITATVANDSHTHAFNNLTSKTSGTGTYQTSGDFRAPIFYDSNNTAYYVDPASTSVLNGLSVGGYTVNPITSAWYTTSTYVYDPTNGTRYYYIKLGTMTASGGAIIEYVAKDDINYPAGVRGQIFAGRYASNSTSIQHDTHGPDPFGVQVYLDNSNQVWLRVPNCDWTHHLTWRFIWVSNFAITSDGTKQETQPTNSYLINAGQALRFGDSAAASGPTQTYSYDQYTNRLYARADFRAPIYYDSNNTGYYCDPNSDSIFYKFQNINQRVAYDRAWGNYPSITVYNTTDQGPQTDFRIHGIGGANGGDFAVRLLVDGRVESLTDMAAPIFRDSNNTAFYADLSSTAANAMYVAGGIHVSGSNVTGNGIILADDGDIVDLNDGYCAMRFSNGVRVHSGNRTGGAAITLASNGSITATGNVTAYSDIRVKDNVEQIGGALERLQAIRGVTYTRNDLEDKERRYAGVIAQEIEEVLPEAVFDNGDRKAVDYNATIGLLIEAIKELKAEVETLKKG